MIKINNNLLNSNEESIVNGLIYSTIRVLSSILIPIFLIPLYARTFGVELLGTFNLSLNIVNSALVFGTFGLTIFFLRQATTKTYSAEELGEIAIDIIRIRLLFCVLSVLLFAGVGYIFHDFKWLELISIAILTLVIIGEIISNDWLYIYFKKQKSLLLRGVLFKLLTLAVMFFFVDSADDYLFFLIFYSVTNFVLCSNFFLSSIELKSINWLIFPKLSLVKKSIPLFTLTLASSFYGKFDTVLYGYMLNDFDFGLFSASYRLIQVALVMITSWSIVLMPYISSDAFSFNKFFNFMFISSILTCLFTYYNSTLIVDVLYGAEFNEAAEFLKKLSFLIPLISMYNYIIYNNSDDNKSKKSILFFIFIVVVNSLVISFSNNFLISIEQLIYVSLVSNLIVLIVSFCLSGTKLDGSFFFKSGLFCLIIFPAFEIFISAFNSLPIYIFMAIQVLFFTIIFIFSLFIFKVIDIKCIKRT